MAGFTLAQVAGLSAYTVLVAVLVPFISNVSSPIVTSIIGDIPLPDLPLVSIPLRLFNHSHHHLINSTTDTSNSGASSSSPTTSSSTETDTNNNTPKPFTCDTAHAYKTEIVSLSPLVIYIHSLITPSEISYLLSTAEPLFKPSTVHKSSSNIYSTERTSSSAGLPRTDPTVQCVLSRARQFLGTMLRDGWDEMGAAQLVRYNAKGQKFDEHHDWFGVPQWSTLPDDDFRKYNRVASFFAILEDQCEGGETWFPYLGEQVFEASPKGEGAWTGGLGTELVDGPDEDEKEGEEGNKEPKALWRKHEKGGLAFRPVAGNALFWINLHPENGTGDTRTNHAGLPILDGIKTAMNIWPRQYYEA